MKKLRILSLTALAATLASCDLFNLINDLLYKNLEEFYTKNNYSHTADLSKLNTTMQKAVYQWQTKTRTYTNTDDVNIEEISPYSDVVVYDETHVTINTKYSERIYVYKDSPYNRFSYRSENNPTVYLRTDGTLMYSVEGSRTLEYMDDEHAHLLQVHDLGDAVLIHTHEGSVVYIPEDLDNEEVYLYLGDDASNGYKLKSASGGMSMSLTPEIWGIEEECVTLTPFSIELPDGYNEDVYYKSVDDEDDGSFNYFEVILPTLKAKDYADFLEQKGYEVFRGQEYGLFNLEGENDGEWVYYDAAHSVKVHLQYDYPIAAIMGSDPKNYGVHLHVQKAEYTFSLFGSTPNGRTDWTQEDKEAMLNTYGTVLPFIELGRNYHIGTTKMSYVEHPMLSPLVVDSKCYLIFDNYFEDLITKDYGKRLVEAGFTEYLPPSTKDEIIAWKKTEDIKYYRCFLSDEYDLAVKFFFDDIYGNTIEVFKKSELKSYHVDTEKK